VLPAYQRRGLATALLSATARAAGEAGAVHLVVNATPQGYEFLSRRGFALLGRGRTYSLGL
jgi:GNAT superfamily N-acetyltransferase